MCVCVCVCVCAQQWSVTRCVDLASTCFAKLGKNLPSGSMDEECDETDMRLRVPALHCTADWVEASHPAPSRGWLKCGISPRTWWRLWWLRWIVGTLPACGAGLPVAAVALRSRVPRGSSADSRPVNLPSGGRAGAQACLTLGTPRVSSVSTTFYLHMVCSVRFLQDLLGAAPKND